jgi:hypothetical protein
MPTAAITISKVVWTGGNTYDVTISFKADEGLSLAQLWELKFIGGISHILHGNNQGIFEISNPNKWEYTTNLELSTDCSGNVYMRSDFQIQFDWCVSSQNGGMDGCGAWTTKYAKSYDYFTGCSADNRNQADADSPIYY